MATTLPKVAPTQGVTGRVSAVKAIEIRIPLLRISGLVKRLRLHARIAGESMIEMASNPRITKVSHVFPRSNTYTSRVGEGWRRALLRRSGSRGT
jgi:hypothetical protein